MQIRAGDVTEFRKTVSESDVYLFAGITGDMHSNHVDEQTMRSSPYGSRIAHGGLVLGLTSNTSTAMVARAGKGAVSYGYDKVRFTRPVFLGDTVTARYEVAYIDNEDSKVYSDISVINQNGDIVMVATHILYFNDGID
ncbi:MaoC family dehydratase [Sciscionella marina]|uniref:MaoC family dehydratase n=1 Tax=Sciscionella marina TaxID=508770 RepID=UPI0003740713|nr:MaoC/PaaZ C-terminal domain-containing protein [Sciscionella marina]